jgi:hypothetical protein
MRAAGAVLAAGVLVVGLAACGDDDDDTQASADDAGDLAGDDGADVQAFCDAAVAVDAASVAAETGEGDDADVEAAMQEALDLAPDAVADDAQILVTETQEMMAEPETEDGPPSIPSDEYFTASVSMGDFLADNCDLGTIDVTATEYAFAGIEETVPAGTSVIRLTNDGTEFHEVALMKVADGETRSVEELLALPEEEVSSVVTDVTFVFAPPGAGSYVTADLDPGRYVALCFVPVGATPDALASGTALDESQPHAMHGMVAEFQVTEA